MFRNAGVGVVWSFTLIVACDSTQPIVAVEISNQRAQSVPTVARLVRADIDWGSWSHGDGAIGFDQTAEAAGLKKSPGKAGEIEVRDAGKKSEHRHHGPDKEKRHVAEASGKPGKRLEEDRDSRRHRHRRQRNEEKRAQQRPQIGFALAVITNRYVLP